MASAFGQCRRLNATFLRLAVTSSSWRCSVWIHMFLWTASFSPISLFTIFWTLPMGKKMFPYPVSMRLTQPPHPRWPIARNESQARVFSLTQALNFWSAVIARMGAGTSEFVGCCWPCCGCISFHLFLCLICTLLSPSPSAYSLSWSSCLKVCMKAMKQRCEGQLSPAA